MLSNDRYNHMGRDAIVVAMTSNPTVTAYSFTITSTDLVQGMLNRPGTVRVDKLYTLEQALIVKTFGRVDMHVLARIRTILQALTDTDHQP